MSEAVLEGSALSTLLLRPTDLVCIVHLKYGVFAETDKAFELLFVAPHVHTVEEVLPRFLEEHTR